MGDLRTLPRLVEQGVNADAAPPVAPNVSAAPNPLRPPPSALAAVAPAAPPFPPPLIACGAAAVPPQYGKTALMYAAREGKPDFLERRIAKGANVKAQDSVRRPHA